jgi:hypothetical protein
MLDIKPAFTDLAHRLQHQTALARSQSKGGAVAHSEPRELAPEGKGSDAPPLVETELVQLHIRVIALENLVIAMLAKGSDRSLDFAREMADYISPRPGFTPHRLTIGAAAEMNSLVERAGRFRRGPQSRERR